MLGLLFAGRYQFEGVKDTAYSLRFDHWTGRAEFVPVKMRQ